jgi:large subunit ribosomal protein L34
MSKRTFQPNNGKKKKDHGFLKRKKTKAGQNTVSARRKKGRTKLSA